MADVDIDPFGEHDLRPEEPTDENIPLDLVTPLRSSTWEPTHEQETSFVIWRKGVSKNQTNERLC